MMNWKRIKHAPAWVVSEIIWYIKWWGKLFYSFGEWIIDSGIKFINAHDHFWEEMEEKIDNWGDWNELD